MVSKKRDQVELERVTSAGTKLRKLREEVEQLSEEAVEKKLEGRVIRQQIDRLEKGRVERPSMHDLCALGEVYRLSPNEMAKLYGYWSGPRADADEPAEIALVRSVVGRLKEPHRARLLRAIEFEVVNAAAVARREDILEELGD